MATSAVSVAEVSDVAVSDSASVNDEETESVAIVQTATTETESSAATLDCSEYWIG
jgi:hypothetical protein